MARLELGATPEIIRPRRQADPLVTCASHLFLGVATPRHVDVAIIGGSNAGLSAALTLGRARRSIAVIDDSTPRNAPASHAHNVYARDGTPPDELRRIGREQLVPYGVHFLNTRVARAEGSKGAFQLELADGEPLSASRCW